MRHLFMLWIAVCASLLSPAQTSQDTQAVKHVVFLFQQDFNTGDFKNAPSYTTADWVHINPLGGVDAGRDAVLKTVRAVHQTFLKGVSMTIDTMHVRFITPDVSIADVKHKISTYKTPDGTQHENERQVKTYVVVKQNGKWLLAHDHNTIVQSTNAAPNQ